MGRALFCYVQYFVRGRFIFYSTDCQGRREQPRYPRPVYVPRRGGFFMTLISNDKMIYLAGMTIIGFMWGSIMSMPYLMLAEAVPKEKWEYTWVYLTALSAYRSSSGCLPSRFSIKRCWAMTLATPLCWRAFVCYLPLLLVFW